MKMNGVICIFYPPPLWRSVQNMSRNPCSRSRWILPPPARLVATQFYECKWCIHSIHSIQWLPVFSCFPPSLPPSLSRRAVQDSRAEPAGRAMRADSSNCRAGQKLRTAHTRLPSIPPNRNITYVLSGHRSHHPATATTSAPAASTGCSSLATPACEETRRGSACTPPENRRMSSSGAAAAVTGGWSGRGWKTREVEGFCKPANQIYHRSTTPRHRNS